MRDTCLLNVTSVRAGRCTGRSIRPPSAGALAPTATGFASVAVAADASRASMPHRTQRLVIGGLRGGERIAQPQAASLLQPVPELLRRRQDLVDQPRLGDGEDQAVLLDL